MSRLHGLLLVIVACRTSLVWRSSSVLIVRIWEGVCLRMVCRVLVVIGRAKVGSGVQVGSRQSWVVGGRIVASLGCGFCATVADD